MLILVLEEQTDHMQLRTMDLGNKFLKWIIINIHIVFLKNWLIYEESWKNKVKK